MEPKNEKMKILFCKREGLTQILTLTLTPDSDSNPDPISDPDPDPVKGGVALKEYRKERTEEVKCSRIAQFRVGVCKLFHCGATPAAKI